MYIETQMWIYLLVHEYMYRYVQTPVAYVYACVKITRVYVYCKIYENRQMMVQLCVYVLLLKSNRIV